MDRWIGEAPKLRIYGASDHYEQSFKRHPFFLSGRSLPKNGNRGGIHAIRVRAMWRCSYPIGGLLFRGRILNLSLNGCYIETALLNLEHGTQVEVYFVTNQLQFRVLEILLRSAGSGGWDRIPEHQPPAGFADCSAGGRVPGTKPSRTERRGWERKKSPLESGLFLGRALQTLPGITIPVQTQPAHAHRHGCHARQQRRK